tara:strand:+ start:18108 stop:18701 length:594 start_codon:yes stop_codon:yes gene_type:complete
MNCINKFKHSKKYNIQNLTKLQEDPCYKNTKNKLNKNINSYILNNYNDCKCEAPGAQEVSLQHPGTFYKDGYGWTSMNGCNIDKDSGLRNSHNLTNMRVINQLYTRPYLTTPYMGRGEGDVHKESILRSSISANEKKACNTLPCITINNNFPLISHIKENIQNPKNIIPEDSDKNWVRGGIPSRDLIRKKNYFKNKP